MGLCASDQSSPDEERKKREERKISRQVELGLQEDNMEDQTVNKLLLLGAGESGKSTLFKQMIQLYGNGFSDAERKHYKTIIANNIVSSIKTLCAQTENFTAVLPENEDNKRMIEALTDEAAITTAIAKCILELWADPGIKATYDMRSKYQLNDSTAYYFERVQEISTFDYVPTTQDVLRSRIPTTGIVEQSFEIEGNSFKMFDVGGQRSERKKWIHCFENVTAVLFVAAISAYDQSLYEDDATNRMQEALVLFEEIANSEWFEKTSIILFLNKRDLFAEKLERVPLKDFFPQFQGPNEYEVAADFIQETFESCNKDEDKDIYTHVTCATDSNHIYAVFSAVKDIIIKKGLHRAGLM